jgi:Sec7-like guanine-nucleotide exchange factor
VKSFLCLSDQLNKVRQVIISKIDPTITTTNNSNSKSNPTALHISEIHFDLGLVNKAVSVISAIVSMLSSHSVLRKLVFCVEDGIDFLYLITSTWNVLRDLQYMISREEAKISESLNEYNQLSKQFEDVEAFIVAFMEVASQVCFPSSLLFLSHNDNYNYITRTL